MAGTAFTADAAGIAPASVAPFVAAQVLGAGLGLGVVAAVYGRPAPAADEVVLPHGEPEPAAS
ncbi:hypothetical protein [Streptomyces sp. NPDC048710]|uniref:hypothetical protein n=1 Tax=unclassified Streptomyces TaxID=2593676 RepID=UPI00371421EF